MYIFFQYPWRLLYSGILEHRNRDLKFHEDVKFYQNVDHRSATRASSIFHNDLHVVLFQKIYLIEVTNVKSNNVGVDVILYCRLRGFQFAAVRFL